MTASPGHAINTKSLAHAINRLDAVLKVEGAKNGKAARIAEVATDVVRWYRAATAENRQQTEDGTPQVDGLRATASPDRRTSR